MLSGRLRRAPGVLAASAGRLLHAGRTRLLMLRHPNLRLAHPAYLGRDTIWVARGTITAGAELRVDRWAEIVAYGGAVVSFGERCYVGHSTTIAAHRRVSLGNDVLIADFVTIRDHEHRFDRPGVLIRDQGFEVAPVVIGDNVWIGSKATITAGVTIGEHSVVGANSVVTRDVAPYTVVGGVPARLIREIPRRASPGPGPGNTTE